MARYDSEETEDALQVLMKTFHRINNEQYEIYFDFGIAEFNGDTAVSCSYKGKTSYITYDLKVGLYGIFKSSDRNSNFDWRDKIQAVQLAIDGQDDLINFNWDLSYIPPEYRNEKKSYIEEQFSGCIIWFIYSVLEIENKL